LRGYNNLADDSLQRDRFAESIAIAERGLELARSRGDRRWEQTLALMIASARVAKGEWDALPPLAGDGLPDTRDALLRLAYLPLLARVQAGRGELTLLERTLELATELGGSSNIEYAATAPVARAIALRALGQSAAALEAAYTVATAGPDVANEDRREAYVEAGLAALAQDDEATVERLIQFVAQLPPAWRSPLLRAGAARFSGLLAARRRDVKTADEHLIAAARDLREIESPFNLAQVLLEHAEALDASGREDEAAPLLTEARAIFERLGASPWLDRIDAISPVVAG
jgi:hypothetical protein